MEKCQISSRTILSHIRQKQKLMKKKNPIWSRIISKRMRQISTGANAEKNSD
jgi:hypothetical protein